MADLAVKDAPIKAPSEKVSRVLFVCTGNTCRSPMAAALCNHKYGDMGICAASAGLYATEGAPITKNAADALAAAGVVPNDTKNYPAHRAHTVTRADIERADRVIGISASHTLELMLRFPDCAAKMEAMPMDIADPYGGDAATYRACLAEIGYSLALLFADTTGGKL